MVFPRLRVWMALALLVGTLGAARERPASYEIEMLPVPPGCQSFSLLHGLGEQERVIGVVDCDGAPQRAVLWDHGLLVEIGSLGGPSSLPFSLSPRGEVVGTAETREVFEKEGHVMDEREDA